MQCLDFVLIGMPAPKLLLIKQHLYFGLEVLNHTQANR
jgi:hypothetical protein